MSNSQRSGRLAMAMTGLLAVSLAAAPAQDEYRLVLPEGVPVSLRLTQPLSSKTARVGDRITLELAKDLRIDDLLVAREGTQAQGEVLLAQKSGSMGKGGDLAIRLTDMKVGDTRIKLRGTQGKAGDSKIGSTVALTLAFGVFGMMKHGKNAELSAGAPISAYVAEDVNVVVLSSPRAVVDPPAPPPPLRTPPSLSAADTRGETPQQRHLLDAASILQMKAAGLSDDLIVAMAKKRGLAAIAPEELIGMKSAGISDSALSKLLEHQRD